MLSVISVGISKCANTKLNIPCADKDAQKVFSTFKKVMSYDFHDFNSICLSNITKQQYLTIIDAVKNSITSPDSILVLYFSCHGKIGDDLHLIFSNYDENDNTNDILSINVLLEQIRTIKARILVILDCCFSGEATKIASLVESETQVSVLAACKKDKEAYSDIEMSFFTDILCKSIDNIFFQNKELSLSNISKEISRLGYHGQSTNIGACENGDFVLKQYFDIVAEYSDFSTKFLKKLKESTLQVKEAMWYSLADIPHVIAKSIYDEYFLALNQSTEFLPEPSWLIRRAIGSTLSQSSVLHDISIKLLKSTDWQEQCIGIIAARYMIKKNPKTYNFLHELIIDKHIKRIDAIWLANLYMSENKSYEFDLFENTDLIKTEWGHIELYKTVSHFIEPSQSAITEMEKILDKNIINNIIKYEKYKNTLPKDNLLFSIMNKNKQRGIISIKAKYLLSMLYGVWRDQVNFDLHNYFKTTEESQIHFELNEASTIPCVEHRMALYEFFKNYTEYIITYKKSLLWGLNDKHPWVRRSAIVAFRAIDHEASAIFDSIIGLDYSDSSYPGLLDVLLQSPFEYKDKLRENLEASKLLKKSDIESVMFGIDVNKNGFA
jgi:hypothetical protein